MSERSYESPQPTMIMDGLHAAQAGARVNETLNALSQPALPPQVTRQQMEAEWARGAAAGLARQNQGRGHQEVWAPRNAKGVTANDLPPRRLPTHRYETPTQYPQEHVDLSSLAIRRFERPRPEVTPAQMPENAVATRGIGRIFGAFRRSSRR